MTEGPAADLAALRRLNDAGYGFYRDTARVRADDLLVRALAADCLHRAAGVIAASVHAARAAVPAPSREQPFPDTAALETVRTLRATQNRLAALETRLRGAAALPDRDFSRIVPSDAVRQELVALDAALLTAARAVEANGTPPSLAALEAALAARDALALRGRA